MTTPRGHGAAAGPRVSPGVSRAPGRESFPETASVSPSGTQTPWRSLSSANVFKAAAPATFEKTHCFWKRLRQRRALRRSRASRSVGEPGRGVTCHRSRPGTARGAVTGLPNAPHEDDGGFPGPPGPWPRPAEGPGGGARVSPTLTRVQLPASDFSGEPRAPGRHHPRGRDSRAQVGSAAAPPRPEDAGPAGRCHEPPPVTRGSGPAPSPPPPLTSK